MPRSSPSRARLLAVVLVSAALIAGLFAPAPHSPAVGGRLIVYGEAPSEFGRLWVPVAGQEERHPVVVLIHGGFWRVGFDSSLMTPLAGDLARRGFAVWNIEYGRIGEQRGGWPHTFEHVGRAVDHLTELAGTHALDLGRVVVVGHSAGGHLALWVGGRDALPPSAPGSEPRVRPLAVVGLAPVLDLRAAARDELGRNAVVEVLGGDASARPERYEIAVPRNGSAKAHVVVGDADTIVPLRYSVLDGYTAVRRSVPGADHFDLIRPGHDAWLDVLAVLGETIRVPPPRAEPGDR